MPPKGHAVLSASSSERWLNCPPSARLCEAYEDKGSDYAAEGTDAHALAESRLKQALGIPTEDPVENLTWYNAEMEDCAQGYGDNEILIEITHVSVEGQTEKRLERIDCNSGKRNIVVEYPNDSYYGLMAAVNNRLAFIKIDETGYQYFWVTPSSSDISLEECAKTEPIGTLFDDKVMTYTIQSDYLCKVNTESKEISATNLITGQVYEFKYPNNLASATWVGLTHLFDDNFALSVDSESGLTQILLNSETGDLTNEVYSLSKTNNYQIIATIQDQVVCYIRSDERMLANQAEYGLSGETCYIDVFAIASKEEFLQGNVGAEISVPVG